MASIKHREGLWDYDLVEKIIHVIGRNKVALAYGKSLPVMTKWNQQRHFKHMRIYQGVCRIKSPVASKQQSKSVADAGDREIQVVLPTQIFLGEEKEHIVGEFDITPKIVIFFESVIHDE